MDLTKAAWVLQLLLESGLTVHSSPLTAGTWSGSREGRHPLQVSVKRSYWLSRGLAGGGYSPNRLAGLVTPATMQSLGLRPYQRGISTVEDSCLTRLPKVRPYVARPSKTC